MSLPQTYFNDDTLYYDASADNGNKNINSISNLNLYAKSAINMYPSGITNSGMAITTEQYANPVPPNPGVAPFIYNIKALPILPANNTVSFMQIPAMLPLRTIDFTGSASTGVGPSWIGYTIFVTNPDGGNSTIQLNSNGVNGLYVPGSTLKFIFSSATTTSASSIDIMNGSTTKVVKNLNPAGGNGGNATNTYFCELFTPDGNNWFVYNDNIPSANIGP